MVTLGAAVVVGGWLGSLSTSGSEIATGLEGATDTTPTNAGPAEDQARQLRVVMGWLGLDDVVIAVRGETIEISGEVPTSLDRNSVFEVASELPDGVEVDLDRLVVAAPVEVARPPLPPGAPTPEAVEALQRDLDAAFASDPVWFEPGTIMLDDQQLEFLAKDVVDLLARGRLPVTIVVAGDREAADGDGAANLRVERATYVRDFLIARGLPPLAVQIASSAPDSSVEDRDRPAGPERGGQVTLDVLELPPGPGPGLPPGGDRAPATDSG